MERSEERELPLDHHAWIPAFAGTTARSVFGLFSRGQDFGAGEGIRTLDILLGKQTLYP